MQRLKEFPPLIRNSLQCGYKRISLSYDDMNYFSQCYNRSTPSTRQFPLKAYMSRNVTLGAKRTYLSTITNLFSRAIVQSVN